MDSTRDIPDEELVRRAREGDLDAFGRLVTRHQDLVFRVARRMARRDPDAALDFAQETFLRAWSALPRFRGDCRFVHWLLRIVTNLVINRETSQAARLAQRTRSLDAPAGGAEDQGAQQADPAAPSPSACAERGELRSLLDAALARLPDEFRAAVLLRDVEGLEYEAIAEVLEIPLGTVRSRLFRGREALKEMLGRALRGDPAVRIEGGAA